VPGQTGHSDQYVFFFKFFFPKCFPLRFCWFVSWLLTIAGFFLWRGAPIENKSPAAVSTKPSRFGTRSLEIASRRCCPSYRWQFAFHRDSTPLNGPWNCEKSAHESTEPAKKNWKNLQFRVPGQRRSPSTRKTYVFESFAFLFFEDILISKKLPFRVVVHTGHSDRNMIDLVIFRAYW